MEIRRLAISDYERMEKLWSRVNLPFKPKGRDSRKAIGDQMASNPDFFLGAFEDNHLVGAVVLSSDLRKGWINRLAVDPDNRSRGIAKALIEESENTLKKHALKIFCALIENDNVASRELFKKCGYVEHHDILYFSKREDDVV